MRMSFYIDPLPLDDLKVARASAMELAKEHEGLDLTLVALPMVRRDPLAVFARFLGKSRSAVCHH